MGSAWAELWIYTRIPNSENPFSSALDVALVTYTWRCYTTHECLYPQKEELCTTIHPLLTHCETHTQLDLLLHSPAPCYPSRSSSRIRLYLVCMCFPFFFLSFSRFFLLILPSWLGLCLLHANFVLFFFVFADCLIFLFWRTCTQRRRSERENTEGKKLLMLICACLSLPFFHLSFMSSSSTQCWSSWLLCFLFPSLHSIPAKKSSVRLLREEATGFIGPNPQNPCHWKPVKCVSLSFESLSFPPTFELPNVIFKVVVRVRVWHRKERDLRNSDKK